VFALCSEIVDEIAALTPTFATYSGIRGHDDSWPDLSLAGHATTLDALTRMKQRLVSLPPPETTWDRLAGEVARTYLEDELSIYEHRDHLRDLDSIASPAQTIVEIFDHMAKRAAADWANICTRLETMGAAIDGYRETLQRGAEDGLAVAVRQVDAVAEQSRVAASADSGFNKLADELEASKLDDSELTERLRRAIETALATQGRFGAWLQSSYRDYAVPRDGVGAERYVIAARRFLGAEIDTTETYRWGWDEVAGLRGRMQEVANEVSAGATIPEALDILKSDPARAAADRDAFVKFMEDRNAAALEQLAGTHFDVPDEIRDVDVKLANPGGPLGAYYVGPSEDFTRKGSVWWSFGTSEGPFPLFDEVSTLYHEGFPGHHLQVGVQVAQFENLSRLHRLLVWFPGLGEGWALYAERLMDQLGFLDKPDYVFGFLAAQMLRACRVVIDIGSHLDLPISDDQPWHPGERWTFELAVEMLREYATLDKEHAESEVVRYLGWPGQAISYKVGEKAILDIRRELEKRGDFDAKQFHADLLQVGPVGLDLLQELLLG